MARDFARIGTDMPDEPSVRARTVEEQWLYDHALYLRREMSRCGVVPHRPAVWAELATNATEAKVRKWLKGLEQGRMVVVDEKYSEVLVRTYVRHDGLLGQPNVVAAMVADFRLIASPTIRLGFLAELRRLWDLDELSAGERGGWCLAMGHYPAAKQGRDDHRTWPAVLDPASLNRLQKAIGNGLRDAMAQAIGEPNIPPFTEGSAQGIPEPFTRTLPPNPLRGRDRGERRSPTPNSGSERRAPDPPGPHSGASHALPGGTHTPAAQTLVDQSGPTVPTIRQRLIQHVDQLLAADTDPDAIRRGLAIWHSRPKAAPGLLPHLVQDQLDPTRNLDPRLAGLADDARRHA